MYHVRKDTRQGEQGVQLGWSEEYVKVGRNVMLTECLLCARHMARRFYVLKVQEELREMSLEK